MLLLETLGVADTGRAAVDANDLSCRPSQRVLGRLRRAATCNKDGMILSIGASWPEKMKISSASLRIMPKLLISVETFNRGWVRMVVVKVSDFFADSAHWREPFPLFTHNYFRGHTHQRFR